MSAPRAWEPTHGAPSAPALIPMRAESRISFEDLEFLINEGNDKNMNCFETITLGTTIKRRQT